MELQPVQLDILHLLCIKHKVQKVVQMDFHNYM